MKTLRTIPLAVLVLSQWYSHGADLEIKILPRFNHGLLAFDSLTNQTATGQKISVTRLDFLLSDVALRRWDGVWLEQTNYVAYISAREGRTSFALKGLPVGAYNRIKFHI